MEKLTYLTAENFEQEVMQSDRPVLIDFWADWCMPCRRMAPVFEELAGEREDVKFCKVNVDEAPQLAMQFRIDSIPAFALVKNGTFEDFTVGVMEKERLNKFLEDNL